jgi:hypothetical protein
MIPQQKTSFLLRVDELLLYLRGQLKASLLEVAALTTFSGRCKESAPERTETQETTIFNLCVRSGFVKLKAIQTISPCFEWYNLK